MAPAKLLRLRLRFTSEAQAAISQRQEALADKTRLDGGNRLRRKSQASRHNPTHLKLLPGLAPRETVLAILRY